VTAQVSRACCPIGAVWALVRLKSRVCNHVFSHIPTRGRGRNYGSVANSRCMYPPTASGYSSEDASVEANKRRWRHIELAHRRRVAVYAQPATMHLNGRAGFPESPTLYIFVDELLASWLRTG
jgi:hypothetical protein